MEFVVFFSDAALEKSGTVKIQICGLGWLAAKCPLFWSYPLFLPLYVVIPQNGYREKSGKVELSAIFGVR